MPFESCGWPAERGLSATVPRGEVWLDLSRLPWRAWRGRMTGIDRVELAYASHLLATCGNRLRFTAFDYRSGFRELPRGLTDDFVRALGPAWAADDGKRTSALARRVFLAGVSPTAARLPRASSGNARPIWLNVSGHPMCQAWALRRFAKRTGAAVVPLFHDLIPVEYPEYVPSGWTRRTGMRLATTAEMASGVITNSEATAEVLRRHLPAGIPIHSELLGVDVRPSANRRLKSGRHPAFADGRPYFVMLGTIEPRKNHLLVLHAWRDIVNQHGRAAAPGLLVVGSRGWDCEQVLDVLERSETLRGLVIETGRMSDISVDEAMAGARALLMPSFVEGYGLPVAEALASGCPVICSDIAAHREIGGDVPEFLDPTDGPAWRKTVMDYAAQRSSRRASQLMRLNMWNTPEWSAHVAGALNFAESVASAELGDVGDIHIRPRIPALGNAEVR